MSRRWRTPVSGLTCTRVCLPVHGPPEEVSGTRPATHGGLPEPESRTSRGLLKSWNQSGSPAPVGSSVLGERRPKGARCYTHRGRGHQAKEHERPPQPQKCPSLQSSGHTEASCPWKQAPSLLGRQPALLPIPARLPEAPNQATVGEVSLLRSGHCAGQAAVGGQSREGGNRVGRGRLTQPHSQDPQHHPPSLLAGGRGRQEANELQPHTGEKIPPCWVSSVPPGLESDLDREAVSHSEEETRS